MPASPHDVVWLPPLEERVHTEVTVKLHSNKARKGDSDYKAPGATPGHGLPKDPDYEKKHPRGGKGTHEGGKFVKKGDTGAQVETVQKELGIQIDGRYDANTASAVVAFQQRHGLEADGVIGRQTALALTGQFSRARKVGPGPLGPYTSKLVGGDSKPKKKAAKNKAAKPAERVGGGLLVAGEDPLPFVAENVTDHLGNVHDFLGKFAPKLGGKGGGHHAAAIPEYDPKNLKFGKLAGGSNGARIATHTDGSKWLVKTYQGGENRVATELLANAVYREMGARVPRAGRIQLNNGKQALAYPLLEGKPKKYVFQKPGARPDPEVGKHFMTDALLANWDVAGLEDDNILWDPQGNPFRVDQGGTLEYRAMGNRKEFGPVPYEVTTMLTGSGQSRRSAQVDPSGMLAQARQIAETLTPARIDQLVNAAGFKDQAMRERVRKALKARVAWMGRFAQGKEQLPSPPGKPSVAEAVDPFWLQEVYVEQFNWDELLHPRDAHGKFIEKIGMSGGAKVQLDAKTFIQRDKDGTYRVVRSGGITKGFTSPADAARAALDKSAKSKESGSVGGTQSYADFNAYLKFKLGKFPDAAKTVDAGVADSMSAYFGGKKMTATKLTAEAERLQKDLAAAKASDDKYRQRAVPTLQARVTEANAKLKSLGAAQVLPATGQEPPSSTTTAADAGAKVAAQLVPGTTFVNSAGNTIKVEKHQGGKLYLSGEGLSSVIGVPYDKAGQSIAAGSWKDVKAPSEQGGAVKVGDKVGQKELDALPAGSTISAEGHGVSWTKQANGGWKGDSHTSLALDSSAFTLQKVYTVKKLGGAPAASEYKHDLEPGTTQAQAAGFAATLKPGEKLKWGATVIAKPIGGGSSYHVWKEESGAGTAKYASSPTIAAGKAELLNKIAGVGSGAKVGDKMNPELLENVPTGTVIQHYTGTSFTKLDSGNWQSEQGTVFPPNQFDSQNYTLTKVGTGVATAKPKKKVSGPQKNDVSNGSPAYMKDLDLAPGDVIQPSGAGGWKYTVTEVKANGSVIVQGPKGGSKILSAYSKPKQITKKDKTPLALKLAPATANPSGLASSPAAATALTPLQIKAKLSAPGPTGKKMGQLAEGVVIQTPDGKVGVMKPSESAYTGYVSAYDISTGQKFEPPADKLPTKVSADPDVMKAAAAALAKVHGQTNVTSASAPKKVTHDVGPPDAFDGVASWGLAKSHIPDATSVGLTPQEKSAIKDYTGSGYGPINSILRNSKSVADITWAKQAALIKKALKKGVVKQDVWIGRQTDNDTWKTEAVAGKVIQDNGVMSSSTTQGVWSGNVQLNVLIRAGSNALHVKSISSHPSEDEVLMPPGSMFHVLKREEKGGQTVLYVEMIT